MNMQKENKFDPGQVLYYKPSDFAPLQVSAGGECAVVRVWDYNEGDVRYLVRLSDDSEERVVKERELTSLNINEMR